MSAKVTEYGAILVGLEVPDKDGKTADVTHGYDSLEGWLTNTSYFGSTVGRYGNPNRSRKVLAQRRRLLPRHQQRARGIPCALHGGLKGFDKVLWSGKTISKDGSNGVELTMFPKTAKKATPANSPRWSPTFSPMTMN